MGVLGNFFLGVTPLTSYIPSLPTTISYNKVTLYGGNDGCIIDSIWGRNAEISDETILNYNTSTYIPTWDINTFLMALFDENLNGGSITGLTSPVTNWLIYRKDPNKNQLVFLAEIDVSEKSYEDFRALLDNTYSYFVFAKNSTEISNPVATDEITSNYYGWFLIDADDGIPYRFDINLSSGSNLTEEDFTEHQTNNRTNSFSRGQRKAKANSINAIVKDESKCSEVSQPNLLLENLNDFIISNKTKYIKDRRGRIYKVFTYGFSEPQLNDDIPDQLVRISFSYKEVGDVFD